MKYIYLLFLLSPLPFASARPVWEYLWVVFIGLSGLVCAIRLKSLNHAELPQIYFAPVGAILFLILWGTLQILMGWSVAPERTVSTTLFFLSHLVWFFLVFKSFNKYEDIPGFILMVSIVVGAYSVYGLIAYFLGGKTVLWYEKWASLGALTSTFVNRNHFAAYAGIGLQCVVAYALWIYRSPSGSEQPFSINKTYILLGSLIVIITCLLLTSSRAGVITSIVATLCLVLIFRFKQRTGYFFDKENKYRKYLFLFFMLIFIYTFTLSGQNLTKRMEWLSFDDLRFSIYSHMLDSIESTPYIGTGLGTFPEVFSQYRDLGLPRLLNGHSDLLEIYMTGGVFCGTFIVLSFVSVSIFPILRTYQNTRYYVFVLLLFSLSLQIGFHSFVDFPLQIPAISYLFVGLWAAAGYLASKNRRQT